MPISAEQAIMPHRWYALHAIGANISLIDQLRAAINPASSHTNGRHTPRYRISDFFVPTEIKNIHTEQGVRKYRGLIVGSYVFIRGVRHDIAFLKNDSQAIQADLRFVKLDHRPGSNAYAIVPDHEMTSFRIAVEAMQGQRIEYFTPTKTQLETGDYIRVIGGPFEGVEGTLISKKGHEGGRVIISCSNLLAFKTLEIEPHNIQLLSLATGQSRSYKKIDNLLTLTQTLWQHRHHLTIDEEQQLHLIIRRYSNLQLTSSLSRKHTAAMLLTLATIRHHNPTLHQDLLTKYINQAHQLLSHPAPSNHIITDTLAELQVEAQA